MMNRLFRLLFPGPLFITKEEDAILAGYIAGKEGKGKGKGGGKKDGGYGCAALVMILLVLLLGIAIYYQI